MKAINQYEKTIRSASFDIHEVDEHLKDGYGMKKAAKKASRKAQRQLDKAIIRDQLNG